MKRCVICRSASEPLRPGNERGHFCVLCMTEVQVGPVGMEQKKLGADLFCNGCGFAMMAEAKKQNLNMSVGMTERAFEEFISNLQKMRNAGNN